MPPIPSMHRQLSLFPDGPEPGHFAPFTVRKSGRARRLAIKVYPGGRVEVVVPRRTRAAEVEAFVAENATWIRDARESFARDCPDDSFRLPSAMELPALGRSVQVNYRHSPRAQGVRCATSETGLLLTGQTNEQALCVRALRRWLARLAKAEFEPRLKALSLLLDTPYRRMQVRAQKTCWGSRSSSGTISLNLCLLFLETEVVRYLLIHELCHGRHMNHSPRFWKMVGRYEPRYRELDRELTEGWKRVPGWIGIC